MSLFVLDSSVAVKWALPEAGSLRNSDKTSGSHRIARHFKGFRCCPTGFVRGCKGARFTGRCPQPDPRVDRPGRFRVRSRPRPDPSGTTEDHPRRRSTDSPDGSSRDRADPASIPAASAASGRDFIPNPHGDHRLHFRCSRRTGTVQVRHGRHARHPESHGISGHRPGRPSVTCGGRPFLLRQLREQLADRKLSHKSHSVNPVDPV